jgi:hypothetical protein
VSNKSLLALLAVASFAVAVVVGMGASAAFAGEVTGNCNHAKSAKASENCKETPIGAPSDEDPPHASSICSFSGQNDGEAPEGRKAAHVQSWGQIPKKERDAMAQEGFHPGDACNGHTGFFSGA